MCSIFLAFESHPKYRLILAANRDEFFDRPTAPADYWLDTPDILAGRDLRAGGTWLGLGAGGRFAAITNYRDPSAAVGRLSRGMLVRDFLISREKPREFLFGVERRREEYSGFNLLAADAGELWYFSNRDGVPRSLAAGIFGLSNHLIDTPWPKVARGKNTLEALLRPYEPIGVNALFKILADDRKASDADLPETGIGLELERELSSIFIRTPVYGTRSATVLLLDYNGAGIFVERSLGDSAVDFEDRRFELRGMSSVKTEAQFGR